MAERLTPEKEAEWEAKMADPAADVTPEQRAAWTWYREQYPKEAPAPLPPLVPEPAEPAPRDPRADSPWYQRAWEHVTGASAGMPGGQYGGYRPPADVAPAGGGSYEPEDVSPGGQTDAARSMAEGTRWALAEGVRLAPMLYTGPVAPAAYRIGGAVLPRVVNAVKGPAMNAATNWGLTNVSERAANQVYPEKPTNPERAAWTSAVPQYLFEQAGRYVKPAAQWLFRNWQATPEGRIVGETVEGVGGKATPAMYSGDYWPTGTEKGLELSPTGGHMRQVAKQDLRLLEDEVQRQRVPHTADRVDQEADRLLRPVGAQSTPGALDTTPELSQRSLAKQLEATDQYVHKNFQDMDVHLARQPLPWTGAAQLPPGGYSHAQAALTSMAVTPDPAAVALATRMGKAESLTAALPAQATVGEVTLAYKETRGALRQAEQMLEEIRRRRPPGQAPHPRQAPNPLEQALEYDVIPVLQQSLTPLEQHLSPYLVDITAPKQWAQGRVGRWEDGLKTMTPEEASKALIPQDVKAAQELLAKDDFVTFQEAQQYRSDLLKVSRTRGPNIGDSASKEAAEGSQVIWQAMDARAQTVPGLKPMHDFANKQFAQAAEMWNSPYLMDLTDASLDDLLTGLVKNERPNDMKTLREALGLGTTGRPVLDDVAQMWLTRKLEAAKRHGGGEISNAKSLLNDLENMTDQMEKQVFPGGELYRVRGELRKVVDMQDAVAIARKGDEASAHELQKVKTRLSSDPALWEAVQSDVLAGVLKPAGSQVKGQSIMDGLDQLRNVEKVLFRPDQFEALDRLAKTTAALQRSAVSRSTHWSPVVRQLEHGGFLLGLGGLAYATGHPGAAAALGAGYVIGVPALGRLLTNPKVVHALADGFATSRSAQDASRVFGAILGELTSKGMSGDIEALTQPQMEELERQERARGGQPLPMAPTGTGG